MGFHLKRGSSGHLLRGAVGHLLNACRAAASCLGCKNSTPPLTWQVVISGVTLCTTCYFIQSFFGLYGKVISGSADGTYCVPFSSSDSDTCVWELTLPTPIVVQYFTDSGCTLSVGFISVNILRITAQTGSPTGSIAILMFGSGAGVLSAFSPTIFQKTTTGLNPNCVAGTFSNASAACTDNHPAFGGTATLTPNGC